MIKEKIKNHRNKTNYKTIRRINYLNRNAITLIALVITIIVLLILAGVTINLVINNGIPKRAEDATKEYTKSSLKEEIEIAIIDARMDDLNIKDNEKIAEKLEDIGAIIIDVDKDHISGEYKDHIFEVDKDGNVTIGDKVSGVKPEIEIQILTTEEEAQSTEIIELKVVAQIAEGEIETIEAINGAVLDESKTNTNTEKYFKVTENGIYKFKAVGKNARINIGKVEINNLTPTITALSLLDGVEKITNSGRYYIKVNGAIGDTQEEKKYSVNVINHVGDMTLNGTNEYAGSRILNSNTYEFGSEGDVATSTAEAKNTVILKVNGNLTINENITLTAIRDTNYGGPKGMVVYCTGNLENNGIINMTARGAKATGENVYLFKNANNTFEYIPAVGAAGGAGYSNINAGYINGRRGSNATNRATGGGGSGASEDHILEGNAFIAKGGNGTSYSGGAGSGGATSMEANSSWKHDCYGGAGSDIGGAGGTAVSGDGVSSSVGAGNPSGGTGGLLVIYANFMLNKEDSKILANGVASASANCRGGGSGGGTINIFYEKEFTNFGDINSDSVNSGNGGAGGNGSITIGSIESGTFVSD